MKLTPTQRKLLATKGYFKGTYGNKIGHENMKGSDSDPMMKHLSLKKNNLPERHLHTRLHENINRKTEKKYLPTEKYLTHEKKRLKL